MGDKFRSEIQKPVKNTLLSGAGHGFPFESFQGSSLLVPVSKDSPSVLYDDVGEADKFVGQDSSELEQTSDYLGTRRISAESEAQSGTSTQSYTGLFSSIFGAGLKQEDTSQNKVSDQQSVSSISSTPRSYSPYVHVPSIQSYSPVLQVPTVTSTPPPTPIESTPQAPLFYHSGHFGAPSPQDNAESANSKLDFEPFSNTVTSSSTSGIQFFNPSLIPTSAPLQAQPEVNPLHFTSRQTGSNLPSNPGACPEVSSPSAAPTAPKDSLISRTTPPSSFSEPQSEATGNLPVSVASDQFNPHFITFYGQSTGPQRVPSQAADPHVVSFGANPSPTTFFNKYPPPPASGYANPNSTASVDTVTSRSSTSIHQLNSSSTNTQFIPPSSVASNLPNPPTSNFSPIPSLGGVTNQPAGWPSPLTSIFSPPSLPAAKEVTTNAAAPLFVPESLQNPLTSILNPIPTSSNSALSYSGVPESVTSDSSFIPSHLPLPSAETLPSQPSAPPLDISSPATTFFDRPGGAPPGVSQSLGSLPPLGVRPPSGGLPPSRVRPPSGGLPSSGVPPPSGALPPSGTLPPPLGAPISLSGASSRYRLAHQKYAPIPGLTSNKPAPPALIDPFAAPKYSTESPIQGPLLNPVPSPPEAIASGQPSLVSPISNFTLNPSPAPPPSSTSFFSQSSTGPAFFEPAAQEDRSQPGLFSPISSVTSNPSPFDSSSASVFNPIAIHPSASAQNMSTTERTELLGPQSSSGRAPSPQIIPPSLNNLAIMGQSGLVYRPAYHHWFLKAKDVWHPFSMSDSLSLEQAYNSPNLTVDTVVATDGGRYDVHIIHRSRHAVYWKDEAQEVRRCSWFHKNSNASRYRPFDENTAFLLETEYKTAVTTNTWRKKVELNRGEYVMLNGPSSISHHHNSSPSPDSWDAAPDMSQHTQLRPGIVKRGVLDEFEIDEGEPAKVDHLVFVVHGIGPYCDLYLRSIEESVDTFRSISHQLMKSHFRSSTEQGVVNRIELLPVSWRDSVHDEAIHKKLENVSLKSIPIVRHFTHEILLDILLYTSPVYCQKIVQQVAHEINTLFEKFKSRNPGFYGGVSVAGHSLGSLILFDMLCHQKPDIPLSQSTKDSSDTDATEEASKASNFVVGPCGTGQPSIKYPQLNFHPTAFFAMGSPISLFLTVRGIDSLGLDFRLPTCPGFYNIFHPFDFIAYRIEGLVNPQLAEKPAVLIPHHKGRKRMHLELKEVMTRVGSDLKQKLMDTVRSTWNTVYQFTNFGPGEADLELEVEKEIKRQNTESSDERVPGYEDLEFSPGCINQGRRLDFVLQEAPLESVNAYISSLRDHFVYWDSEDIMLMFLKEIYNTMGVSPDIQLAGPTMSDDPLSPSPPISPAPAWAMPHVPQVPGGHHLGVDPTLPMSEPTNIKPPPTTGFIRK